MIRRAHQYWKLTVMAFVVGLHVAVGLVAEVFLSGESRRAFLASLLQRNCRVLLAVMGVELTIEGGQNWRVGQPYLVAANHLSYLDPLLLACFRPICFVSSVEMSETRVLGPIMRASGTIFVERRSRENIRQEMGAIENVLRQGFSLAFFPEGTSTDGSRVREFKRAFFAPAQRAGVPVLPVVVQPTEIDGVKITSANRDFYCWYGNMDFAPHFMALAGLRGLKVTLKILPEILASEAASRDDLAGVAAAQIVQNYCPISP